MLTFGQTHGKTRGLLSIPLFLLIRRQCIRNIYLFYSLRRLNHRGTLENCRWITHKEQMHNIRNNRNITVNGVEKCISEWCAELGISPGTIYEKVRKGMTFEEAILDSKK